MARVHVIVPHSLDATTARARLKTFLDDPSLRERLQMHEPRWTGDVVDLEGEAWSGTARIGARDVEVDLQVGGFLALFAGSAEGEIRKKLGAALR